MSWHRLIRFLDDFDQESFGEPLVDNEQQLVDYLDRGQLWADVLVGDTPTSQMIRGKRSRVKSVLDLFRPCDVPIIRCIGLNYKAHIEETKKVAPPFPSVFIKPSSAVAGFKDDVPIPPVAQDGTLDYEGELVTEKQLRPVDQAIVIGKLGKDIPKESALEYVAGYVVSNDLSARDWQRNPKKAGVAPQWCFGKGFDKFAPFGPMMVSPNLVGRADTLQLQTLVNGELRQNSSIGDLLFGVEDLVSFCGQGTTLEAGSIILTGTPSGVGMGMDPPQYLVDGDVVEVRITELGSVINKMAFK